MGRPKTPKMTKFSKYLRSNDHVDPSTNQNYFEKNFNIRTEQVGFKKMS